MKKVGRLVPSLGYQSAYFQNRQIGTRAWWSRVLCEVPEPTKLGYQSAYFENYHAFGTNYADWYPSLVDSGTSQSTRVHQTRVPICLISTKSMIIFKIGRLVPELGGLEYLVKYPTPPSSSTNLPILKIGRLVPQAWY